ncbi:MAG TPA: hypothetical protein VIX19_16180, partial [Terriglobales bacterium]
RVRHDLLAVMLSAATALAAGLAAHQLRRLIFRWLEDSLTVGASPFDRKRPTNPVMQCAGSRGCLRPEVLSVLFRFFFVSRMNARRPKYYACEQFI